MMDKRFDSNYIEKKWYKKWLESGAFASNNQSPKEPYVIMMPPPNVTCLLYTSPSPRDVEESRMPSSA